MKVVGMGGLAIIMVKAGLVWECLCSRLCW